MKEEFKIAHFYDNGQLTGLNGSFKTYDEAKDALEHYPIGTYQIQKVFIKE